MGGVTEQIYKRAPVAIQHALVSAYGWHWYRLRFGGRFEAECRGFRERERFSSEMRSHCSSVSRSFDIYIGSTAVGNFEIGSTQLSFCSRSEREIEYLLVIRDHLAALQLSRTARFGVTQVSAPFAI
jgi:hypothetical protein